MGFCCMDGVKWELFEKLLPKLLYMQEDEAESIFLDTIKGQGQNRIYDILCQMCEEDQIECPYDADDFEVGYFKRGNLHFIQMNLPAYNPAVSDIVRAYILYSEGAEKRYFLIRHSGEGELLLLYVTPELQVFKMEELTGKGEDRNFEYWKLAVSYLTILQDVHAEEKVSQGCWSHDWLRMDWELVREKIRRKEHDIGLTKEEYEEFLQWYAWYDKEIYEQTVLYLAFGERESGAHKQS